MTWILFLATAAVIVLVGVPLARYAGVIGEKTGLRRTRIGVVLLARHGGARYLMAAALVVGAALALPRLGAAIARESGLGETFVGSLFVAVTTSLPEIVVSLTAVRIGAIDLGVGNVLGSNLFILGRDDLFLAEGRLLAAVDPVNAVSLFAIVVMNGLFLVELTHRELRKRFVVAWDTGAIAVVYAVTIALVYRLSSSF